MVSFIVDPDVLLSCTWLLVQYIYFVLIAFRSSESSSGTDSRSMSSSSSDSSDDENGRPSNSARKGHF